MQEQISLNEAIKRLVSTYKTRRVMRPDYGLDFSVIDTPASELYKFRLDLVKQLNKYIPKLQVERITFEADKINIYTKTGLYYG